MEKNDILKEHKEILYKRNGNYKNQIFKLYQIVYALNNNKQPTRAIIMGVDRSLHNDLDFYKLMPIPIYKSDLESIKRDFTVSENYIYLSKEDVINAYKNYQKIKNAEINKEAKYWLNCLIKNENDYKISE